MITPEQALIRKNGIGGSDVAAICGLSKWKSPLDVFLEKTSKELQIQKPIVFERGNKFEPWIKNLFEKKTGKSVSLINETIYDTEHSFMFAHMDGLIKNENALVEFKHYSKFMGNEWGEEETDSIPTDYLLQVQHYLYISKLDKAYVAVLLGTNDSFNIIYNILCDEGIEKATHYGSLDSFNLKIFEIYPDEKIFNILLKVEKEFWINHVKKNNPPKWKTTEDLIKLFPVADEKKELIASTELIDTYYDVQEKQILINQLREEIKNKTDFVRSHMGTSSVLKTEDGNKLATWNNQTRKTFHIKDFELYNPELAKKFTEEKSFRVFKWKLIKSETKRG